MTEKSAEASASGAAAAEDSGNWWDSWLTSAKTKSAEVYSMVRKDLDEIGSAVKSEATHVFSTTSTVIGKTLKLDVPESPANVMKKSFSTFIGQVSTALSPEPDDEDDTEVILSSGDTTMLSTYKKELEALQRVDATFIVPAYSGEFDAWLASLETGGEPVISPSSAAKRLDASPLLREQYKRLVPDAVSHDQFWERYLFRVALLQDRLAAASRKQPAEATEDPVLAHLPLQSTPEESPKKEPSVVDSDSPYETPDIETVAWEDEDFANDVELTEEQQILLLEEYEKEIATKKQLTKQTSSRDIANNNTEDKTTNTTNNIKKGINTKSSAVTTKSSTGAAKSSTGAAKSSTGAAKSSTGAAKSSTGNAKNVKNSPSKTPVKAAEANKTNTGKSRDKMNNKSVKKSPKKGKTDDCGNNLVEDYFGDNQVKDDASANSDESWEKEFEIEEVEKVQA